MNSTYSLAYFAVMTQRLLNGLSPVLRFSWWSFILSLPALCLLGGTFVYNKNFIDHFATVYAKYTHHLSQYAGSTWGASYTVVVRVVWLHRVTISYSIFVLQSASPIGTSEVFGIVDFGPIWLHCDSFVKCLWLCSHNLAFCPPLFLTLCCTCLYQWSPPLLFCYLRCNRPCVV